MGQEERQPPAESTEAPGQDKQLAEVPPLQVAHDEEHWAQVPVLLYCPAEQLEPHVEVAAAKTRPVGQVTQLLESPPLQVAQVGEQAVQVPALL